MVKCDASLAEDVTALQQENSSPPLVGLFHAGGVLADATVNNQTAAGILTVFAPKATALQKLDAATGLSAMQNQVFFSSVAALLGSVGQLNYSIANSWLDAVAAQKQAAGVGVVSTQFGAWKGAGMAAVTALKMEAMGLGSVTPETGLASLTGMLRHAAVSRGEGIASQIAVSPIDWPNFLKDVQEPGSRYFANFAHLKNISPAAAAAEKKAGGGGASTTTTNTVAAGMKAEERAQYIAQEVQSAAAAIIGGTVSSTDPLMAAGLDSLGAVELRNSLEGRLGLQLPSTLVFDYPTIDAISAFVGTLMIPLDAGDSAIVDGFVPGDHLMAVSSRSSGEHTRLLVTGISSRSPQDVLHCNTAVDAIGSIPTSRWDAEIQLTKDMPARFGGFISNAFGFDAAAFSTSTAEAMLMDPQQRLTLELTEESLSMAGLAAARPAQGESGDDFLSF